MRGSPGGCLRGQYDAAREQTEEGSGFEPSSSAMNKTRVRGGTVVTVADRKSFAVGRTSWTVESCRQRSCKAVSGVPGRLATGDRIPSSSGGCGAKPIWAEKHETHEVQPPCHVMEHLTAPDSTFNDRYIFREEESEPWRGVTCGCRYYYL